MCLKQYGTSSDNKSNKTELNDNDKEIHTQQGPSTAAFSNLINLEHISTVPAACLPPLATIEAVALQQNIKGNTVSFKTNNTPKKDSMEVKKRNEGKKGHVLHPINEAQFKKHLNQTYMRKTPYGCEVERSFRQSMLLFLKNKTEMFCFSQRHNKCTKSSCLKELLEKEKGDDYTSEKVRTSAQQAYPRDNELDRITPPPSYSKKML